MDFRDLLAYDKAFRLAMDIFEKKLKYFLTKRPIPLQTKLGEAADLYVQIFPKDLESVNIHCTFFQN
jgi:hypothetical protein